MSADAALQLDYRSSDLIWSIGTFSGELAEHKKRLIGDEGEKRKIAEVLIPSEKLKQDVYTVGRTETCECFGYCDVVTPLFCLLQNMSETVNCM